MFSFIRTQIDQLVSFLRPLRLNERTDSGETLLSGPPKRSYCSRSITLHQDIKTPCHTRDALRSSAREKRLSARTANATTRRERAVSFDSKGVRNLLDDDDDHIMPPVSSSDDDQIMPPVSSSDDEGLDCWFSPVEPQLQKDPLPVSLER